jgi:hypothetical protein
VNTIKTFLADKEVLSEKRDERKHWEKEGCEEHRSNKLGGLKLKS